MILLLLAFLVIYLYIVGCIVLMIDVQDEENWWLWGLFVFGWPVSIPLILAVTYFSRP